MSALKKSCLKNAWYFRSYGYKSRLRRQAIYYAGVYARMNLLNEYNFNKKINILINLNI